MKPRIRRPKPTTWADLIIRIEVACWELAQRRKLKKARQVWAAWKEWTWRAPYHPLDVGETTADLIDALAVPPDWMRGG